MKILIKKYPVDIILCMAYSLILLPIILLDLNDMLHIILGLPFVLFIPGYILTFAFFPTRKTDRGIDLLERVTLSFGFSIAVVSIVGLGLNYTPWGIRLESILICIFVFVIGVGALAVYRWFNVDSDERFKISLDLSLLKSERKLDKALTILIVVSIIIAISFAIYAIMVPKTGERFTAFYVLDVNGTEENYPKNLVVEENATVVVGLTNHEYQTIHYTIEIWLINQTRVYNELTNENETIYHNAWFIGKLDVTLNHTSLPMDGEWGPQWEYNYTFNLSQEGKDLKLTFLLFTEPTEKFIIGEDYIDIAEQRINSAYRENHLWIDVYEFPINDIII